MHMKSSRQLQANRLRSAISDAGLTQMAAAKALDISQSQISRLLSGKGKRQSNAYRRLCIYVSRLESASRGLGAGRVALERAIEEAWDGTDDHAEALATVIRSLKALRSGNATA